jgi:outer membrane protein
MNKIALPISVIALVASVFTFFYLQSKSELVYVDVNKLFDGYKRTKIVKGEYEEKAKVLNANVDSLMTDWQKELKVYEKERSSMSKKELELKQQLLSNKQNQINNYQQAIKKQLSDGDKKSTQTLINDINDYVKNYGKKHKYKIIFGASGSGNIMYASEGSDLTGEILEGLNADFNGQ